MASAAGSSSKKAMSAQLSDTRSALSDGALRLAVGHQGLHYAVSFERPAQALDGGAGHGAKQDALRGDGDRRLCSALNLESPSNASGDHNPAFGRELNRSGLRAGSHEKQSLTKAIKPNLKRMTFPDFRARGGGRAGRRQIKVKV